MLVVCVSVLSGYANVTLGCLIYVEQFSDCEGLHLEECHATRCNIVITSALQSTHSNECNCSIYAMNCMTETLVMTMIVF